MLHFILGRAGTGKTARIADEIACEIAGSSRPVVLLVPEQQTVAWETKMAARLPVSANLRLEITNFTRLANSVFREYGGLADAVLDEGSRILLVWRAMLSVRDSLAVYRAPDNAKNGREDRSLPKLLRAVDDFKSAGVSPADAEAALTRLEALPGEEDGEKDSSGSLADRMRDAVLVYAAYEELLHEPRNDGLPGGMDRGDLFHHLLTALRAHPYFRGKAVFVDSFFSLTAPEEKILDLIFRQADETWVTFACPPADALSGDEFQFAEVREFYKTAVRLADRANRPFERIALTEDFRHRAAPLLARVEQNLFRYAARPAASSAPAVPEEIPAGARKSVEILRCADLWDEAEACAARIDRLLRAGYACREIAVVARNIDTRAGITDAVLRAHGIPCFLSDSTAVSHSPAVRLVLAALSGEANGWQRRDVMRLVKTGLTPAGDVPAPDGSGASAEEESSFSAFAEDAFEQYAAVWNIRGRRMFTSPRWSMNPAGYRTEITPQGRALLEQANAVKDRVIPPLARFLSVFSSGAPNGTPNGTAPVRDVAAGIVALAEEYGIAARLSALGDACRSLGLPADAMRAEASWDAVCRILDSMVDLLGDTALDAGRFAGLFSRAAAALDAGTIPTGQDEVVLGSASGVRFDEARCVIMLGVTDGEFPGAVSDGPSFFDDRDKQLLETVGLPIGGPDTAMQSAREAFMFYRTAASASESLLLLAPADGGKTLSEGARRIADILSSAGCSGVRSFGELPLSEIVFHPATAEYLLSRRPDPGDQAVLRALVGSPGRSAVPLTGVSDRIAPAKREGASASGRMRLSQSKIEAFLTCPFRYACRYRVRLEEPAEARITAADVGNFVHAVLERYFTEIPPSGEPVSEEEMRAAASRIIGDYMTSLGAATGGGAAGAPDGRLIYLFRRLERHVLVFLRAISEEMAQSAFRPAAFEMPIGASGERRNPGIGAVVIRTPDGAEVTLDGVADRADVWRSNGKEYLRIVDYKTGAKSFSLERVARGLDVQVLLYLFAVWRNGLPQEDPHGGERIPAGAVYFTVKPKPFQAERLLTADEARARAEGQIERAGVWLNDEEAVRAMDRDLSCRYVPVKKDGNGCLTAKGKAAVLATLEEFGALRGQIEEVVGQIADRIRSGSAEARPQRISAYDPCETCAHRVICRRQPSGPAPRA